VEQDTRHIEEILLPVNSAIDPKTMVRGNSVLCQLISDVCTISEFVVADPELSVS